MSKDLPKTEEKSFNPTFSELYLANSNTKPNKTKKTKQNKKIDF